MDGKLYQHYLQVYVKEAIDNSDGTNVSISRYLWGIRVGGRFARHKVEKGRALEEARRVFDQNRHWPLSIVLSHLGLEPEAFGVKR